MYNIKFFSLDLVEKLDKKIVQFILSLFLCNFGNLRNVFDDTIVFIFTRLPKNYIFGGKRRPRTMNL